MADTPEISKTQQLTNEFLEPWRESEPNFPFGVVANLIVAVVDQYPEITLLTNDQARQILRESEISLPAGVNIMDIAGKANPGIVRVRMGLRENTNKG